MLSLTYISRPTEWTESRKETLEDIRAVSTARNTELNITGLLIATCAYFAHVLEGPDSSINLVMGSIMRDPRHSQIIILDRAAIAVRRFKFWRLECFEREMFADHAVTPLLSALHAGEDDEAFGRFTHLTDTISRIYQEGHTNCRHWTEDDRIFLQNRPERLDT